MATQITFRRGSSFPTAGSGITLAEPVFETTLHTFHIGLGYGITAEWVGAPISGLSADIAAGITYKIPTAAAVKNYINGLCFGNTGGGAVSSVSGSGNGVLVSPTTGAVVVSNTGVHSFNGLTGAVQGVSAAVAGTGISVSGATGSVTITNIGVQSFNGRTGAVTGASLGANTFTGLQTMTLGISAAGGMTLAGTLNTTGDIKFNGTAAKSITTTQAPLTIKGVTSSGISVSGYNAIVLGVQTTDPLKLWSASGVVDINSDTATAFSTSIKLNTNDGNFEPLTASVTIQPSTYFTADRTLNIQDASGTIALTNQLMGTVNGSTAATTAVTSFNGLTGAVGGVCAAQANTFTALQTFNSGISAAGGITFGATAAFSNSAVFANAEYIRNTTNGQLDLMPAPAGSTAFGIYFDMTSWSYGVIMGTIRTSDGLKNTGGNFRFDAPLTINNDTFFQLGSDGQYRFQRTSTGNDTAQFGAYCDGVNNSGAYAIVGFGSEGTANRSPATKHSNPNLYIYANGNASANDFVRFEHDRTNANIVSGGTSGIFVQPGNGIVGVSGGVSADAFMLAGGGIRTLTGTTYTFLATDNGKVITMNNASGITATVPSGLPVGYSVTVIQLGAGQVGFTAASGVTLNSYTSLRKIAGQHGSASVVSYSSNVFNLAGNLA